MREVACSFHTFTYRLTRFDIAFRSGEEPTHASRADFLTRSALDSRRGFRALVQGRVPRETLITGAAWHFNLDPVLKKFVPDTSGDIQLIAERLRKYDLILDDYRSGSSLRRESEAREELAVDLVLSTDVFSAHPFAKPEAEITEDDKFETMSRAAEAMTLSETEVPSVHFGYLSPLPAGHHGTPDVSKNEPDLALSLGVRLLLAEWDTGVHPDRYAYHDPYDDLQQTASSHRLHNPIQKSGAQTTPSRRPPLVTTTAPPVIALSRAIPMSSSQPETRRLAPGAQDVADLVPALELHSDSHAPMASTQVERGLYGGRPIAGKQRGAAGKKRMGGF
jgi:RNA polymerase I-specific transcription-initiation factor